MASKVYPISLHAKCAKTMTKLTHGPWADEFVLDFDWLVVEGCCWYLWWWMFTTKLWRLSGLYDFYHIVVIISAWCFLPNCGGYHQAVMAERVS